MKPFNILAKFLRKIGTCLKQEANFFSLYTSFCFWLQVCSFKISFKKIKGKTKQQVNIMNSNKSERTSISFIVQVMLAAGLENSVEQFPRSMSPGRYRVRIPSMVGLFSGISVEENRRIDQISINFQSELSLAKLPLIPNHKNRLSTALYLL